jgi:integrase/recombinase XerD
MNCENKTDSNKKRDKLLKKYYQYLRLEKSLSANTLDAYVRDLRKLTDYLDVEGIDLCDVKPEQLESFLAGLYDVGICARSMARILSGIRSFYGFLVYSDVIEADPCELIEGPKIGMKLPEVLTVDEIDRIIAAVDLSKNEGQRNRAMLETLYSCGLRVSELINLKLSDLYFNEEFIRVTGKGDKQRLVPISPRAIKEIELYMIDRNQGRIKPGFEDYLFLARWGNSISRIQVFQLIKSLAAAAGIKKNISPHTFRHSFATHLLEGGANLIAIQNMLGHESITTTEIYTHMDSNRLRSEIIEHHPRNILYRERKTEKSDWKDEK